MNKQERSNTKEINTDIILLDTEEGINRLRKLYKESKTKELTTNNIQCQYKDFTFDVALENVNFEKEQDTGNIKTIISKPKNLEFNGQSCNASKEDDKNTITIINDGEELQFENFTFNKQPYNSDKIINKTIFDNIVETGITQAFGYNEFDIKKNENVEYNFPLYYNANGIFKIPNRPNNSIDKISIQNDKYDLTDKSAILFTPNATEEIDIIKNPSNKFQCIVIDVDGKTFFNVNKNNPASEVKNGKFYDKTKAELRYDETYDQVNKETETQNNNNIFAKIFCCCCNKTSVNKKAEINIPIVHQFRNLKEIVVK